MRAIKAILIRNLKGFIRNRMRLIFTFVFPFFLLFIFSFAMKMAPGGLMQPINYLLSGIIIMTVFQTALNNSMDIIEDIASGFMKEIIVAPLPRWQISIGQVLSSMTIAVIQGLIILIISFFIGLKLDFFHTIEIIGIMILVGFTFSSIGLFLATMTKSSSAFQVMVTVIAMPLTLISGALIPVTSMPGILRPVIFFNPLSYTASIFRFISLKMENLSAQELLKQGVSFQLGKLIITPQISLLIIILMNILFFALCVYRFNRSDFSKVKVFKH